jgi:putative ATPase
LLSRCKVFVLRPLDREALGKIIARAEQETKRPLPLTDEARDTLCALADGDGRYLINLIESVLQFADPDTKMDSAALTKIVQQRSPVYDKDREGHYNLISALHKSLRGSDPDAALYWAARMISAGEDPLYLLRRLTRFSMEDVGLADPNALQFAISAWDAYERLGSPEGDIALAELIIYLGTAPKSNSSETAWMYAMQAAKETGSLNPPAHILNAPTKLMKQLGYGKGYQYDHDTKDGFSGQNYFPDEMPRRKLYHPVERGFEREIIKRLDYWEKLRRSINARKANSEQK